MSAFSSSLFSHFKTVVMRELETRVMIVEVDHFRLLFNLMPRIAIELNFDHKAVGFFRCRLCPVSFNDIHDPFKSSIR